MLTNKLAAFAVLALLSAPLSCALTPDEQLGTEEEATVGSGTPVVAVPSTTASTVSVKNGLTVTFNTELTWRAGQLVLTGSTNADITFVSGFIPDDGFGTATQLGKRSFELAYSSLSDLDTILSGARFWVELGVTQSGGSHEYAVLVTVAPRLVPKTTTTTTRLVLGGPITPVYVSDNPNGIHYRGTLTSTQVPNSIGVTAAVNPTLTQDGPHAWHFDWLFDGFLASSQSTVPVEAKAKFGATTSTRDARIAARLSDVELALTSSPDDTWGFPVCDPKVAACIAALPMGTIDYGSCGPFQPVYTCLNQ